ncbi:MAG: zinc metalloprotease HtpX [Candidatus Calescibacterium sp.]|nr:zinc metalloprotease HtpX [Candidatus Calescibacterium sp.]MCX7734694.1 zinc metalloprotease HtpX [bacterium]MDW8087570.1 zinc metalloprotease HtpX [Candidatus Calescibacterium sp.]
MVERLKTFLLLTILTAFLLFMGNLIGGKTGLTIALIMAGFMNLIAYFFSDKIVLAMYRARELSEQEAPALHRMVQELSVSAGIPKPKLYIVPSPSPNAFATGRNPSKGVVAVTDGIVKILNESELRGVIAHEIAHIKNRDTLVQVIAATIAGAIMYLADMLKWGLFFFGGRSDDREEGGGGIAGIIGLIAISILAPIAAMIIQFAISRSREFLADETGAKIANDPLSLASALKKITGYAERIPMEANPATSHLFIVNPLSGSAILSLFSTHPPVEKRIERLYKMAGYTTVKL